MRRYFKHLMQAIMNRNPFKVELEKTKQQLERTTKAFNDLDEKNFKLEQKLAEVHRTVADLQTLVENLRTRLAEKEEDIKDRRDRYRTSIEQMKEQHRREVVDRHEEYEEKLNGLREDLELTLDKLQTANKAIANDMLAQSMLTKTNNGLEDLCAAMATGDIEKMMMATQYLDWSSQLVRIAQYHLQVLKRRNELVERLHFIEDENVNYE